MAKAGNIPAPAVRRLSLYLRQLEVFQTQRYATVSSRQLGEALAVSDAQVRRDLAYFGQFGHPGVGYRVPELTRRLRVILGTDKQSNVLLVGVGNLGRALIAYRGFQKQGFSLVAAFDHDTEVIGHTIPAKPTGPCGRAARRQGIRIQPMREMAGAVRRYGIRLGLLTVPGEAAQSVAEQMVAAGIRGILNFAPVSIQSRDPVSVASVDLAVHLEQLSFQLGFLGE
jgi:redox-sensing transcriptional repressor